MVIFVLYQPFFYVSHFVSEFGKNEKTAVNDF